MWMSKAFQLHTWLPFKYDFGDKNTLILCSYMHRTVYIISSFREERRSKVWSSVSLNVPQSTSTFRGKGPSAHTCWPSASAYGVYICPKYLYVEQKHTQNDILNAETNPTKLHPNWQPSSSAGNSKHDSTTKEQGWAIKALSSMSGLFALMVRTYSLLKTILIKIQ